MLGGGPGPSRSVRARRPGVCTANGRRRRSRARAFRQGWVHAYRGEPEATQKASEESSTLLQRAGVSSLCLWPLGALGFLELSRGNPSEAHEALGPIAEIVRAAGVGEPAATPFVADAIEALLGTGNVAQAEGLTQWLQECSARLGFPWTVVMAARCRGMVLAVKGDLDGSVSALEQAMAQHQSLPMPIEKARTMLAKGVVHRRRKEKRAAKEALEEALASFQQVGASRQASAHPSTGRPRTVRQYRRALRSRASSSHDWANVASDSFV
jgi:hypothetical protein